MYLTTWSRYAEPDWLGSLAYKSDGYHNAANRQDIDALVESGAGFYETSKRRETYLKLNQIILREAWFALNLFSESPSRAKASPEYRPSDGLMEK